MRNSVGGFARASFVSLVALACSACSGGGAESRNGAQAGASAQPAGASRPGAQGAATPAASAEQPAERVYRGTLSGRGIEVRLARAGDRLSGSYSYDGIGQPLRLEGREAGAGKFTLSEFDPAGKETGRFSCDEAREGEWDQEISCNWTKAGGAGGEVFVALFEQHADAKTGLRVAPKVREDRKLGVRASFPQLAARAGAQLPDAAANFNRLVERKIDEAVAEFARGVEPGQKNLYFQTDYNVLLATDDLVSVEWGEDTYSGGAHPSFYYRALTYDLRAGRELKLAELFTGGGYEKSLRAHAFRQANERARAGNGGGGAGQGGEPLIGADMFGEVAAWGLSPRGLFVYYDLPHVIAAFQRTFVPYAALREHLRPDGPAAKAER